jgi:hypothetical protein
LGTVSFGTWNHVVVRHNGSKVDGFLNGVKSATSTAGTRTQSTDFYLGIGRIEATNLGANAYFKGSVDEFRIWNTARTDGDIIANYKRELSGTELGLVSYYNFNQGAASSSNTSISTINDISSNAKNLILSGLAMTGATSNIVASNSVTQKYSNTFTTNAPTATSHQWQVSTDKGISWTNITDAQTPLVNSVYYVDYTTSVLKLYTDNTSAGTNLLFRDITSNSCGSTTTNAVALNPTPSKPIITINGPMVFCAGGGVTFTTPSVANTTYQWYNNGVAIGGATNNSYTAIQSGSYSLTATTVGGCSITNSEYRVDLASKLSTSLAAYNSASDNALVPITSAEYNALKTLVGANITSANDAGLATTSANLTTGPALVRNTNMGTFGTLMTNGYVLATKVKFGTASMTVPAGMQIGYGTTTTDIGVPAGTVILAVPNLTLVAST